MSEFRVLIKTRVNFKNLWGAIKPFPDLMISFQNCIQERIAIFLCHAHDEGYLPSLKSCDSSTVIKKAVKYL